MGANLTSLSWQILAKERTSLVHELKSETSGQTVFYLSLTRHCDFDITKNMNGVYVHELYKYASKKPPKEPVTTYHEQKIGKTIYRVTSVYLGKIELSKALEDLAGKKNLCCDLS